MKSAHRNLIIAIDGPAGAGKSTVARRLARRLGYLFINTGAMYRAVAWKVLTGGISLDDLDQIGRIAEESRIELSGDVDSMRVSINGCDVTNQITAPEVSQAASRISALPVVRRALVARQQEMGRGGGVVIEGRDIGTQVFPQAGVKIYLDASPEERSRRRFTENNERGLPTTTLEELQAEIEERDHRDQTRSDSPLVRAADATYINSSTMTIDEVIERIVSLVEREKAKHSKKEVAQG
ncbi:MAG TPA: (d)CMP kinase [Blastocatellia bacterium]|nr:(d)CMP kinase [Blastocatellia bacterium]